MSRVDLPVGVRADIKIHLISPSTGKDFVVTLGDAKAIPASDDEGFLKLALEVGEALGIKDFRLMTDEEIAERLEWEEPEHDPCEHEDPFDPHRWGRDQYLHDED